MAPSEPNKIQCFQFPYVFTAPTKRPCDSEYVNDSASHLAVDDDDSRCSQPTPIPDEQKYSLDRDLADRETRHCRNFDEELGRLRRGVGGRSYYPSTLILDELGDSDNNCDHISPVPKYRGDLPHAPSSGLVGWDRGTKGRKPAQLEAATLSKLKLLPLPTRGQHLQMIKRRKAETTSGTKPHPYQRTFTAPTPTTTTASQNKWPIKTTMQPIGTDHDDLHTTVVTTQNYSGNDTQQQQLELKWSGTVLCITKMGKMMVRWLLIFSVNLKIHGLSGKKGPSLITGKEEEEDEEEVLPVVNTGFAITHNTTSTGSSDTHTHGGTARMINGGGVGKALEFEVEMGNPGPGSSWFEARATTNGEGPFSLGTHLTGSGADWC